MDEQMRVPIFQRRTEPGDADHKKNRPAAKLSYLPGDRGGDPAYVVISHQQITINHQEDISFIDGLTEKLDGAQVPSPFSAERLTIAARSGMFGLALDDTIKLRPLPLPDPVPPKRPAKGPHMPGDGRGIPDKDQPAPAAPGTAKPAPAKPKRRRKSPRPEDTPGET